MSDDEPFWKCKTLAQMSAREWESLCDHCGLCCLVKLEEEDTGAIHYTRAVCALYDCENGGCTAYEERHEHMPDCLPLTPQSVPRISWLPETCAYRRLAEGRDLPAWHPLITGDPDSTRKAGISIIGRVISEREVDIEELPDLIHDWSDT